MYSLHVELKKIAEVFEQAGIVYEVVGGVAVNAHLLRRARSRSFVTRDVDLLVRREDLDRIVAAAVAAGYEARRIVGGFMLRLPHQDAREAVHLLFAGERSKSTQPAPHPEINPVETDFFGLRVPVAPIGDLVRMKLTSFRAKDLVHLETLDEAGLITGAIESTLDEILRERLARARAQFLEERPDEE